MKKRQGCIFWKYYSPAGGGRLDRTNGFRKEKIRKKGKEKHLHYIYISLNNYEINRTKLKIVNSAPAPINLYDLNHLVKNSEWVWNFYLNKEWPFFSLLICFFFIFFFTMTDIVFFQSDDLLCSKSKLNLLKLTKVPVGKPGPFRHGQYHGTCIRW